MHTTADAMPPTWLRRTERDAMALGSPLFYFLVVGRGLVGPFWDLVVPLLIVGAALLVTHPLLRGVNLYLTRAAVLGVLTTNHYGDAVFALFAAAAYCFVVFAARDLGGTRREVLSGVLLGVCVGIIGYGLALPFG